MTRGHQLSSMPRTGRHVYRDTRPVPRVHGGDRVPTPGLADEAGPSSDLGTGEDGGGAAPGVKAERSLVGGNILIVVGVAHEEKVRAHLESALTHLPAFFRSKGVDIDDNVHIDAWACEDPCERPKR